MKIYPVFFCFLLGTVAITAQTSEPRKERVLTAKEQDALTPEQVFTVLKQGNLRFASGTITRRDHSAMVRDAVAGQFPKAIILSCVDSRIPVEDVFDRGIGDIFVARVAGNFENTDILGSIEYATRIAGAKLILVLGHTDCGAIKAAIDGAELGNITAMLQNIQPAIAATTHYEGDRNSSNKDYVRQIARMNVQLSVKRIRERSAILKEMEDNDEIRIVGALYDMKTGIVEFIN